MTTTTDPAPPWTLQVTHHDEVHTRIVLLDPTGAVSIEEDTADDQGPNLASKFEGIRVVAAMMTQLANRASGRRYKRDQGSRPEGPLHDPRDLLDLYGYFFGRAARGRLTLEIDGTPIKDANGGWISQPSVPEGDAKI